MRRQGNGELVVARKIEVFTFTRTLYSNLEDWTCVEADGFPRPGQTQSPASRCLQVNRRLVSVAQLSLAV